MTSRVVNGRIKSRNEWFHENERTYRALHYRVSSEQQEIVRAMMTNTAHLSTRAFRELYVKCAEIVLGESTATNREARQLAKKLERIIGT